jgi:hypothetical protein
MAYGTIKVDTITFTDAGVDKSVSISGLVQNPTFSGNITVTGTISGNTVQGQTVSGATVTGNVGSFSTITGGTVTLTSGVFGTGTAAAPSIAFTGDSNTGIYSPGADQVAVATNGTQRLLIKDASQDTLRVSGVNAVVTADAIGSNYPGFRLAVNGSILAGFDGDGGTSANLFTYAAVPIIFGIDSNERLRITSAGLVGIGTSTARAGLTVGLGSSTIPAAGASTAAAVFGNATDAGSYGVIVGANGSGTGYIQAQQVNGNTTTYDLAIQPNGGNVGIGTTAPGYKLSIAQNGAACVAGVQSDTQSTVRAEVGSVAIDLNVVSGNNTGDIRTATNHPLTFQVNSQEKARIDSSGRLLVGTSNTDGAVNARVQINGGTQSLQVHNGINSTTGCYLTISKSRNTSYGSYTIVQNNDAIGGISFRGDDGTSYATAAAQITAEVDGTPGANDMPGRLVFSTTADGASSPTERMRITSAGLVGIGTSSPDSKLTVADSEYSPIEIKSNRTTATDNLGGLHFKTVSTDVAYIQSLVDGTIKFRNTSSLTERLRITSAGLVGIGTTTPDQTLVVNGGVGINNGGGSGGSPILTITNASGNPLINATTNASALTFGYNGTERVRIDSSGRLLVGTSSSRSTAYGDNAQLQVEGTSYYNAAIAVTINSNNSDGPSLNLSKSRGTSVGSNTIVQDGDNLGVIAFGGADGNDAQTNGARIQAQVDGTPGANDMPGRLVFSTTADGANSPTERLRIDSSGRVGIGIASPAVSGLTIESASSTQGIELSTDTGFASGPTIRGYYRSGSSYRTLGITGSQVIFGIQDVEKARLDASGRLLVGTSSYTGNATIVAQGHSGDSAGPAHLFLKTGNTSPVSGGDLGYLFFGDANTSGGFGAWILGQRDGGTWTSGSSMPGRLQFATTADGASSPTERMRITKTGATGVKSESGSDTLFITNGGGPGTTNYFIRGAYGSANMFDGVGAFGVYTNGNVVNTNNSYGAISDVKLKENIVDASSQWDDLKALQIRNYNFKEGQTHTQIGLVAQEAELVSPGLVSESPDRDEDGNDLGTVTKSVNYSVLYMKAVKALQEAMERIEVLEQRLNDAGIN